MSDWKHEEKKQGGKVGKWMVTFGDAVTLLLTFFVLMLTYASPTDADLEMLSRGFLEGMSLRGVISAEAAPDAPSERDAQFLKSWMNIEGTEKPTVYADMAQEFLRDNYKTLDLSQVPEVESALLIRVPLDDIISADGNVSREGRALLEDLGRILNLRPSMMVARVESEDGDRESGIRLSMNVLRAVESAVTSRQVELRMSFDMRLGEDCPAPGVCEIVILER